MNIQWQRVATFFSLLTCISVASSWAQESIPKQESAQVLVTVEPIPGFPPFDNVDDPHPPEKGDWENNFLSQGGTGRNGANAIQLPYFDFNYGCGYGSIFGHMQCKIEGGYNFKKDSVQDGFRSGMGNMMLGLKWMFYDGEDHTTQNIIFKNMSFGTYPQVRIAPLPSSVRRGIVEGDKVYTFPFLVSEKLKVGQRPVGLTFNIAFEEGTGGNSNDWYWSSAAGIAVNPKTAAMISVSQERVFVSGPNQIMKVEVGVVRNINERLKAYGMYGKIPNLPQNIDGQSHTIWNAGVQVLFKKGREDRNRNTHE